MKGTDLPGQLFTDYYLTEGIRDTAEWKDSVSSPGGFDAFRDAVNQRYESVSGYSDPNESVTEAELIRPVLELLGWVDYLPQQGDADAFNQRLTDEIQKDGRIFLSTTQLDGRFVLRLAVLSFRTHLDTIDLTLEILKEKIKAIG